MKKCILLVSAMAFGMSAFAQDLKSKMDEPILPEAGDWSIGFDAAPFLTYFGNFIHGSGATSPFTGNWTNGNMMITGKYYASETMAYRAMVRIGMNSSSFNTFQVDQSSASTPPAMVTDNLKRANHFIGLGAGVEMRRGHTRLQGYYGGQFMFWMSGMKDTYKYGNPFTSTFTSPTSTDWSGTTGYSNLGGGRMTSMKVGSTMGLGLRGFIGCEYFIMPKISLGIEYGWGLAFQSTGEGSTVVESWNGTGTVDTTTNTGKSSKFGIDTDNMNFGMAGSGSFLLHVHF